jgi:thymidylate synthase (FAD)
MNIELLSATADPEKLIEAAARTCYQSNHLSIPEKTSDFIQKLISMGHETPLEHAYASFKIDGASRTMTHQLVRHRLMAVSQKSQRYVSEDNFEYVTPPSVKPEDVAEFNADMLTINSMYGKWIKKGLKKEDARFVLPNACTTEIMISANFREFRHIFKIRCSRHAQWEIREVSMTLLEKLNEIAPGCFSDLADEFLNKEV